MSDTSKLLPGESSKKPESHEGTDSKTDELELRVVVNAEALLRTSCTINQLADLLAGKEGSLSKDALFKALINSTTDKTVRIGTIGSSLYYNHPQGPSFHCCNSCTHGGTRYGRG